MAVVYFMTSQMKVWLDLGRVSNLPSVWTNVLAAALLASAGQNYANWDWSISTTTLLPGAMLALSLMYLGGMLLNDVVDADWDRQHQNPRPINQGRISQHLVQKAAIFCLVSAVTLLLVLAWLKAGTAHLWPNLVAALFLVLVICGYNFWHKKFRHSVWLMGLCRCGVYLVAATLLATPDPQLLLAGAVLAAFIAGVTYLAQQEHLNQLHQRWPVLLLFSPLVLALQQPQHAFFWVLLLFFSLWILWSTSHYLKANQLKVRPLIGLLLASIPLLDALVLASIGQWQASLCCIAVFLLLPRFQLWVRAS
jgi:4-hydroxybenzoate polyprenyltransferase